jgi:RNA polymerase sigma-70 factor, ECF subfamily
MLSEFEQRRRLQLVLDALPLEQREAFLLRVEGGLGLSEIATATGAGHETVKSRLRYAFAKIREKLSE